MQKHGKPQRQEIISLIATLEEVPDPRVDRSKDHDLVDLLVIALCTILVGGDSFYDMEEFAEVRLSWLKTFLRLRNGAPSHDTFNRVFQVLDERQLADSLSRWTQSVRTVLGGEVRGAGWQERTARAQSWRRLSGDRQCLGYGKRSAAGAAQSSR